MVVHAILKGFSSKHKPHHRLRKRCINLLALLLFGVLLLAAGRRLHQACRRPVWWPVPPPSDLVELVVSHHSESLDWLRDFKAAIPASTRVNVTVYSKGPKEKRPAGAVPLPNVGRDTHTFLHHLYTRYHSLSDVSIFLMASANKGWWKQNLVAEMRGNWTWAVKNGFYCPHEGRPDPSFNISEFKGTTDADPQLQTPASHRPLSAWFDEYIGGRWPCTWCGASILAVSRDRVRQRPRSFYKTLLDQVAVSTTPEAGHYVEHMWGGIFRHPDPRYCMPPFANYED